MLGKPTHSVLSPLEQQFQTALDNIYMAHPDAVGMLVHVEAPDYNISWSEAVGFANMDKTKILSADQQALLASNTKTYVAAATLRLVERGKLKLDTPIGSRLGKTSRDDLTGGEYDLETITILHLLNHTSGIFDYNAAEGLFDFLRENSDHVWTREEQIYRAVTLGKPLGKAGEILAMLIQIMYCSAKLLNKLQAKLSSRVCANSSTIKNRAWTTHGG